jgi:hypothetical protein
VDEPPLTGSSMPPSLGFGDPPGVKTQEGAAAGVTLKSIDLSNFQLVRTSTGPILVKQMQNSNKVSKQAYNPLIMCKTNVEYLFTFYCYECISVLLWFLIGGYC